MYLNRINKALSTSFVYDEKRMNFYNSQGYKYFQAEIEIKLNENELDSIIKKNKSNLDYTNSIDDLMGREHYSKTLFFDEKINESITIFVDTKILYYNYNEK